LKAQYIHTNVEIAQSSKKTGDVCGDVVDVYRNATSTNIVLCDGIGSGLKANIYAKMCCARIIHMLREGSSVKRTFETVGETMNKAWGTGDPFSVFTIVSILNTGNTTIMAYDMPSPIFICKQYANVVKSRTYYWKKALIHESHLILRKNEGVVIMSDGITQAGLGNGLINGWESEGVVKFVNLNSYIHNIQYRDLTNSIHKQALKLWGKKYGDDCTVVTAYNKRGITLNVLTGTPESKEDDNSFVMDYMQSEGIKVVCGGSTSMMLARELKKPVEIKEEMSPIVPPSFIIPGITLATEGMITLNQLFNLLNEDIDSSSGDNIVLELLEYFQTADKILFWVGKSGNIGHNMLELKQQGIQNRLAIVKLIAHKLRELEKLVVIKTH